MLPLIHPQPLLRIPEPFNDPAWIWELKLEGFRALAYLEDGECRLLSRNGHTFKRFDLLRASLGRQLKMKDGILDGEIVCLDEEGRSLFNALLFRRCNPVFAVFDLLWLNGKDLRQLPLIERKRRLRALVPVESPSLLHVDFVPENGKELFELAWERDLEGICGKCAQGIYQDDGRSTSWVKVKNGEYSQAEGRAELFEPKLGTRRPRPPELKLA
jgi:bifunctional non-homologous end joining protein LigD